MLAQDWCLVQIHTRAGDLWRERFVSEGAIELDDPRLRIEVAALYAATELAAQAPDATPNPVSPPAK